MNVSNNLFNRRNWLLNTDCYKVSQWKQIPKGTTKIFSYGESRGGPFKYTVFFGLQAYLKEYLSKPLTNELVEEAIDVLGPMGYSNCINHEGINYILDKHGGFPPIEIRAIPEGSIVPISNALFTVTNIDEDYRAVWATQYLETSLLRAGWYGTTVATVSHYAKKIIEYYFEKTAEHHEMATIPSRLHDFGCRGVSSYESAGIGGAAHLINFNGSDTIAATLFAKSYYNCKTPPSFASPASEHSTITIWGKNGECDALHNMLDEFKNEPVIACVGDSFNIYDFCKMCGTGKTKQKILKRSGVLIIRPDSGYPPEVILKCLEILGENFGFKLNSKGYKVLHPKIRLIQGDRIDLKMLVLIFNKIISKEHKWCVSNLFFGMGGKLLQASIDRDVQQWAIKCSAAIVDDQKIDVYKDPIHNPMKKSKRGFISLFYDNDTNKSINERFTTDRISNYNKNNSNTYNLLEPIWRSGDLLRDQPWDSVCSNTQYSDSLFDIKHISL